MEWQRKRPGHHRELHGPGPPPEAHTTQLRRPRPSGLLPWQPMSACQDSRCICHIKSCGVWLCFTRVDVMHNHIFFVLFLFTRLGDAFIHQLLYYCSFLSLVCSHNVGSITVFTFQLSSVCWGVLICALRFKLSGKYCISVDLYSIFLIIVLSDWIYC